MLAMASETPQRPTGRLLDFRGSREELRDAVRAARIATARAKVITTRSAYYKALEELRRTLGGTRHG